MTIDVTAVNDAPQGADNSVNTLEDTAYIFVAADFGLTDPNDSPGQHCWRYKYHDSCPAPAALPDNGVAVQRGSVCHRWPTSPPASSCSPRLPMPTARVMQTSPSRCKTTGVPPTVAWTSIPRPHTMTINVASVNDAPTGTNNTVTTNEDTAYTFGTAELGRHRSQRHPGQQSSAAVTYPTWPRAV